MYYEVAVVFKEEIQTKNGVREKKTTKQNQNRRLICLRQKV